MFLEYRESGDLQNWTHLATINQILTRRRKHGTGKSREPAGWKACATAAVQGKPLRGNLGREGAIPLGLGRQKKREPRTGPRLSVN